MHYLCYSLGLESVLVVTNDGRILNGVLRGFDQVINLVLEDSVERVFSTTAGVEKVPLGLYIVRGDNVSAIGEVDESLDSAINWDNVKAQPLKPTVH